MDDIELSVEELSPLQDVTLEDDNKLQDIGLGFGEVIYVGGVKDHNELNNLDYESSGHTGFASSEALSNVDERVKSLEEIGIPEDGKTPYIGENGNWFIGEEDTGVKAEGKDGTNGIDGVDGVGIETITQGEAYEKDGYTITPITFTKSNDIFHTFGVKAKNGKSENLELYATKEYVDELIEDTENSVKAIEDKIGVVEENKTVVEMIADAQAEATYDDTALSNRVTTLETNSATHQEVSSVQTNLNEYKTANDTAVKANADAIGVLNGNSITEGSVDYKVTKAINEFAQAVTSNETIDTFAEVVSYISTHGEEFSELVGEVDKNTKSVETLTGADNVVGSVDYKIKNAIANENLSQYATDIELKSVSDRVKAIEEDYATDTDFTNLNNQVQGMYTNAQIDSAISSAKSSAISTAKSEANAYTDGKVKTINSDISAIKAKNAEQDTAISTINTALDGKQPSGDYALNADIPTKVSELENDSGYITSAPVTSVNGQTGAVNISIPTVNNGTLTIQKNGTNIATFTANQSGNSTANIAVPTKTSDLTNDSGFITGYTESDPTVPSWAKQSTKPSYSYNEITGKPNLATVATSGSYNDLSNKPTIPSISGLATESYVDTKVANLVNSAPETLNTLGELATAIQNHEDEYDALLETVGNKANKSDLNAYMLKDSDIPTSQLFKDVYSVDSTSSAPIVSPNGLLISNKYEFTDAEGNTLAQLSAPSSVPITAGNGINIATSGATAVISNTIADSDGNIPTSKLFKDVSAVDAWYDSLGDVVAGSDGISWTDECALLDADDNAITTKMASRRVPIVAGSGISITTNTSGKAEISSTGGSSKKLYAISLANTSGASTQFFINTFMYCENTPTVDDFLALHSKGVNGSAGTIMYPANGSVMGTSSSIFHPVTDLTIFTNGIYIGYSNASTHVYVSKAVGKAYLQLMAFEL